MGLFFARVPHAKHGLTADEEKYALEKTYRQFFRRHHTGMFQGIPDVDLDNPKAWELRSGRIYIQVHSTVAPEGNLMGWLLATESRASGRTRPAS